MSVVKLKVDGKKFVLLPEKEYLALRRPASGSAHRRRPKTPRRTSNPSREDRNDVAESKRRLAEGRAKPYAQLRRELGLG
jgi:hypothetical protein